MRFWWQAKDTIYRKYEWNRGNQKTMFKKTPLHLTMITSMCLLVPTLANGLSLKPKFESSERFGETFTAAFHGDDDSVFLFQFIFSNAGFGDGKAACRLLSIPKGKNASNHMLRFDEDEWAYRAHSNTLDLRKCTLTSDSGGMQFQAHHGDLKATLRSRTPLAAMHVPSVSAPDGFYEAQVLLKGAPASVSWSAGNRRSKAIGRVYLDHTRSTATMSKLANVVYRIRAMSDQTRLFQVVQGKQTRGWFFKSGDHALTPLHSRDVRITASDVAPKIVVTRPGFEARISAQRVLYRYKPVEAFGMMGKLASPIIGNPETVTFLAEVTYPDGRVVPALMERTIVDP